MSSTVVATFTDATKADLAVIALERIGILPENITVVETDTDDGAGDEKGFKVETNPFLSGVTRKVRDGKFVDSTDHTKDAPLYTVLGCIGGCVTGVMLTAGLFSLPGYSHLIDASPLVSYIGGGAIGGVLGGSIAALSSSGRKYTELKYYKSEDSEHYIVAVTCNRDQSSAIVNALTKQGGDRIRFIPQLTGSATLKTEREAILDKSGFARF